MLLAEFTINIFLRNLKTLDILKISNIPTRVLENEKIKSYQKYLATYSNNENSDIKPLILHAYKRLYLTKGYLKDL